MDVWLKMLGGYFRRTCFLRLVSYIYLVHYWGILMKEGVNLMTIKLCRGHWMLDGGVVEDVGGDFRRTCF